MNAYYVEWSVGVILLAGGLDSMVAFYDSDTELCEFRQEAFFRYLFPFNEPNAYAAIETKSGKAILFVEEQSAASQRWNGNLRPLDFFQKKFKVDEVRYTHELSNFLKEYAVVYTLDGLNTDSKVKTVTNAAILAKEQLDACPSLKVDQKSLYPIIAEARVLKTPLEIEHMRRACLLSSMAHVYVMRHCRPGLVERQLEGLFQAFSRIGGGCRHMSYTCICGTGSNGAILHYGHAGAPNDRILQDGDMMVLDMGAEFSGYATDITLSYPANGIFTDRQIIIYNAVLDAQKSVESLMKPGVWWPDMHRLAERIILTHLRAYGLLKGDIEDMLAHHVGAVFMPHGLGHLLGLNTHDVGGFLDGAERLSGPGIEYLRTTRYLKAGMVLTVEPGCYFNDPLLDAALGNEQQSKFINVGVLNQFRGFGGVRLEDDILVTENGIENFTIVPREIADIQAIMKASRDELNALGL